ncbi:MAG: tetraacyldisaccharide 4'-kinase [Prolixibacteraceae bacterium]|nr:tetraacyldisaccharide 4'-kinase [Prolixibacteraceae bacterium]
MIKLFTYPLSMIYGLIISSRNFLYDSNILHHHNYEVPVISVGNLTVGGTGKTPHAEYLINILRKEFKVAFISRGYKRKSKGFILATSQSTINDIGDEPVQIKQKYPDVTVAVSKKRDTAIRNILNNKDLNIDVIILDDAFQHRRVEPNINILLFDFTQPVYDDMLLPAGKLRESIKSSYRANFIIFTKCPGQLKPIDQRIIKNKLDIRPYQNLFFTSIVYGEITPAEKGRTLFFDDMLKYTVMLVTGIANPSPLIGYLKDQVGDIIHKKFPDHYAYTEKDLDDIYNSFKEIDNKRKLIITTEKDLVRLKAINKYPEGFFDILYYIPIEIKFLDRTKDLFNKRILTYVRENKSNSRLHKR